jgi:hypothetical protein
VQSRRELVSFLLDRRRVGSVDPVSLPFIDTALVKLFVETGARDELYNLLRRKNALVLPDAVHALRAPGVRPSGPPASRVWPDGDGFRYSTLHWRCCTAAATCLRRRWPSWRACWTDRLQTPTHRPTAVRRVCAHVGGLRLTGGVGVQIWAQ